VRSFDWRVTWPPYKSMKIPVSFELLFTLLPVNSVLSAFQWMTVYHILSYHFVDLKWQNHLIAGTDKPKSICSQCQMMMSRKDFLKSHVLSWQRNVYSDWEDVTSSGRAFQVFGPPEVKVTSHNYLHKMELMFSYISLYHMIVRCLKFSGYPPQQKWQLWLLV